MEVLFLGCHFQWTLLLADVQFPILGVDFLCHLHLMADPAANCLVDRYHIPSGHLNSLQCVLSYRQCESVLRVAEAGFAGCHWRQTPFFTSPTQAVSPVW